MHKQLGPGLLEGVCDEALAAEMELRHIPFARQKLVPATYTGQPLNCKLHLDFLVGGKLGLLINFNVERAADGIYRKIHQL